MVCAMTKAFAALDRNISIAASDSISNAINVSASENPYREFDITPPISLHMMQRRAQAIAKY